MFGSSPAVGKLVAPATKFQAPPASAAIFHKLPKNAYSFRDIKIKDIRANIIM